MGRAPKVASNVEVTVPAASDATDDPDTDLDESSHSVVTLERRSEVYTFLLIGTDDGNGNADTIMVARFDIPNGKISLVSVPRDTLVDVPRKLKKVNASYGVGGIDEVKSEVSKALGIPIDFKVEVNLKAFKKVVNAIGGVYFDVPKNMDYDDPTQDLHIHLKKGNQLLDGDHALQLVRCRSAYSSQDLGRIDTQQQFLKAMLKQVVSSASVSTVTDYIKIAMEYVKTDLSASDLLYFAKQAMKLDLDSAMNTATLPGEWDNPYYQLDEEKTLALINSDLNPYTTDITSDIAHIYNR